MKKVIRWVLPVGATLILSSCSGMLVAASTEGIREYGRSQNGLVVTGKSAPNQDDSYHQLQRHYDSEATLRTLGRVSEAAESWGSK